LKGNKKLFKKCLRTAGNVTNVHSIRSRVAWNRWNWREDLIRACDALKPDFVLFVDSDEAYGLGFDAEFEDFANSDSHVMMFDYEMVTDDGRSVIKYPKARHCKAYRWRQGISYRPYKGYARPVWPARECVVWNAETPIRHFCFYTKEMEQTKELHK
jgi:hypothetical protein